MSWISQLSFVTLKSWQKVSCFFPFFISCNFLFLLLINLPLLPFSFVSSFYSSILLSFVSFLLYLCFFLSTFSFVLLHISSLSFSSYVCSGLASSFYYFLLLLLHSSCVLLYVFLSTPDCCKFYLFNVTRLS